jgi:hypothetical protein
MACIFTFQTMRTQNSFDFFTSLIQPQRLFGFDLLDQILVWTLNDR